MKIKSLLIALFAVAVVSSAQASAQNDDQQSGFGLSLGVKSLRLQGTSFSHDTHKDDSFLPNASVPGSAGTTSLDGGGVYYASLGINYIEPLPAIAEGLLLRAEFGGLAGGQEDRHKNANDSRPDSHAAFVYSDSTWGLYGSIGLAYKVDGHFYFGADAEYNGVFISNGWERYGRKESEKTNLKSIVTAGPVIGYDFDKNFGIEAGAQFGNSQVYELKIKFRL